MSDWIRPKLENGGVRFWPEYNVGVSGPEGRGIQSITVQASGKWLITYTDGTTQELDTVPQDIAAMVLRAETAAEVAEESLTDITTTAGTVSANAAAAINARQDAQTAASDAASAASTAADVVTHVADAVDDAETYAEAAGTAKQGAETAHSGAETAQGKAEDAQAAAETAKGKAEDAQGAAETAKRLAEDARDTSAMWATGGSSGTPSETNNAKYYSDRAVAAAQTASTVTAFTDFNTNETYTMAWGTKDGYPVLRLTAQEEE